MTNVTNEQCENRVNAVHAKLDKILDNQSDHGERLARLEEKAKSSGQIMWHLITGAVAAVTAYLASKWGK